MILPGRQGEGNSPDGKNYNSKPGDHDITSRQGEGNSPDDELRFKAEETMILPADEGKATTRMIRES